jgi:hypothetical protein
MQVSDVVASDRKYCAVPPCQRFIVNEGLESRLGLAPTGEAQRKRPGDTRGSRITRRVAARAQSGQRLAPGRYPSASRYERNSADDPHRWNGSWPESAFTIRSPRTRCRSLPVVASTVLSGIRFDHRVLRRRPRSHAP